MPFAGALPLISSCCLFPQLLDSDQELYKNFPLVISERWQQEVAETVYEAVNADTDKIEARKRAKNKQLGHAEGTAWGRAAPADPGVSRREGGSAWCPGRGNWEEKCVSFERGCRWPALAWPTLHSCQVCLKCPLVSKEWTGTSLRAETPSPSLWVAVSGDRVAF